MTDHERARRIVLTVADRLRHEAEDLARADPLALAAHLALAGRLMWFDTGGRPVRGKRPSRIMLPGDQPRL